MAWPRSALPAKKFTLPDKSDVIALQITWIEKISDGCCKVLFARNLERSFIVSKIILHRVESVKSAYLNNTW